MEYSRLHSLKVVPEPQAGGCEWAPHFFICFCQREPPGVYVKDMTHFRKFFSWIVFFFVFYACDEELNWNPIDTSGIEIKSVDVYVDYSSAIIFGDINVSDNMSRITGVEVHYGTTHEKLDNTANGEFDNVNGFSVELAQLEDGTQYYYRTDILVGKASVLGVVKDFVTFPLGPVDLDLPSGNKWASCNLGAAMPTESGDYFAWAEIQPKTRYDWDTYKWGNAYNNLVKYTTTSYNAVKDNIFELVKEDDAASQILGEYYYTPSYNDWKELFENCTITTLKVNGLSTIKISSSKERNNNKKFIVLRGDTRYFKGTAITASDSGGHYWTSTLNTTDDSKARSIEVYSIDGTRVAQYDMSNERCFGLPIRPIYKK